MDLPQSVAAIGERLDGPGTIVADGELLTGADVFASERDRLFMRPWMAVDHATRLCEDERFFRFDAATRSILVTRAADGRFHALRNVCIHAGYPVCDAEEGAVQRLVCPYHGWEFTLQGRLVDPDLSARIDPERLRLASYPVCVQHGLIFVDLSTTLRLEEPAPAAIAAPPVPVWLCDATVTQRARYSISWNWKPALQLLKSSPQWVSEGAGDSDWVAFGPLSLMLAQPRQAALLRIIPKSAERTDIQLIRMIPRGAGDVPAIDDPDPLAEGLRQAAGSGGVDQAAGLDRPFFSWYWSLMSAN